MFDESELCEAVEDDGASTYLTFDLGGQTLGVEVRHVREIIDRKPVTRLPNAPADVLGVVDVRGASVPIVDLHMRLGVAAGDFGDDARIVVLEFGEADALRPLGILADRVRNVDQIGEDEIEPVPGIGLGEWDRDALRGLCRRETELIVLLKLGHIFGAAAPKIDLSAGAGFF